VKAKIKLFPEELGRITEAMGHYSQDLKDARKPVFDIALNKVRHSGRVLELDGCEMKCAEQALRKFGWLHYSFQEKAEASVYFQLAQIIKEIRVRYQQENGPKIEKTAAGTTV
jgi:hypothetical protein